MKNRAKCKKCESVIESFHNLDYVTCKCGEISVDGGDSMRCAAVDWANFVRVDDRDNEVLVSVKDESNVKPLYIEEGKPTKRELLGYLEGMIKSYEKMPDNVRGSFITGYDFEALMILLSAILNEN